MGNKPASWWAGKPTSWSAQDRGIKHSGIAGIFIENPFET
jgi:hypothetical protein